MANYEGKFNLILGSDLQSGAYQVRISTEGHVIDEEGQVIATIAPWPFALRVTKVVKEEEVPHAKEGTQAGEGNRPTGGGSGVGKDKAG